MDMLYYIYIGSNRVTIDHLNKITGGMFMAVSSCNKAAKVIDGIRERYNTSILYEESTPQKDSQNITFLHKRFPRVYIILITEGLQKEHRKLYLQAGVNNTLSPMASEESLQQMTKFLQLRKEHKLQEFSQSHRKIFNTFHLPMLEAYLRHPFCRCRTDCAVSHTHRDSHSHPRGKQGKSDLQVPACGQQLPDIQLPEVPLHVHQCRQAPERAERPQPI